MKLYFAAAEHKDYDLMKWCGVRKFLTSYFYARKKGIAKYANDELFLDSGAFSAFTQKKHIDIDEYIAFIKRNQCEIYAGLDVIGDAQKTEKNINYMKEKGLRPIPTFHKTSERYWIHKILDSDFDYIALGGMAGIDKNVLANEIWLDKVWNDILIRRPDIKVHGFGMTTFKLIKRYPWYSIDSTTWNVARKFGEGFTPVGKRARAKEIIPHMRERYGILVEQFSDDDLLTINTILYMLKIENEVNVRNETYDFSYLTSQKTLF